MVILLNNNNFFYLGAPIERECARVGERCSTPTMTIPSTQSIVRGASRYSIRSCRRRAVKGTARANRALGCLLSSRFPQRSRRSHVRVFPVVVATHQQRPRLRTRGNDPFFSEQFWLNRSSVFAPVVMPTSMTASHGGVLYYVVKVPKDDPTLDYVSATASHKYLEEKRTLSPLNMEWESRRNNSPTRW